MRDKIPSVTLIIQRTRKVNRKMIIVFSISNLYTLLAYSRIFVREGGKVFCTFLPLAEVSLFSRFLFSCAVLFWLQLPATTFPFSLTCNLVLASFSLVPWSFLLRQKVGSAVAQPPQTCTAANGFKFGFCCCILMVKRLAKKPGHRIWPCCSYQKWEMTLLSATMTSEPESRK